MVQSSQPRTSSITGAPVDARFQPMPANLSPPLTANRRDNSSCSSLNRFTQKWPAALMCGHVVELWAAQNDTSGGSSETDVNELAARPYGLPSSRAVMTVTP